MGRENTSRGTASMVWFVASVYLPAALTAGIEVRAAALGPWGIAALAGATLTILGVIGGAVTREGRRVAAPQLPDRADRLSAPTIWSLLG